MLVDTTGADCVKACSKCGSTSNGFARDRRLKSGLRSECKLCKAENARAKGYYQKPSHKKPAGWWSEYASRPEVRERLRLHYRAQRKKHREYSNAKKALRASRIVAATPRWVDADDRFVMREIYELARLRTKLTGLDWHVDHIVPISGDGVCGLHVPANLRVIPAAENLRKSNTLAGE